MKKSEVESMYKDLMESLKDTPDSPIEALENVTFVAQGALTVIKQILQDGIEMDKQEGEE